jgi:hypothetical protein
MGTLPVLSKAVLILGPLYTTESGTQQNKTGVSFMFALRVLYVREQLATGVMLTSTGQRLSTPS